MNAWGQCFRQCLLELLSAKTGKEDDGGRESSESRGGGEDAFLCGGITLTAVWKRCPRQCLLEF